MVCCYFNSILKKTSSKPTHLPGREVIFKSTIDSREGSWPWGMWLSETLPLFQKPSRYLVPARTLTPCRPRPWNTQTLPYYQRPRLAGRSSLQIPSLERRSPIHSTLLAQLRQPKPGQWEEAAAARHPPSPASPRLSPPTLPRRVGQTLSPRAPSLARSFLRTVPRNPALQPSHLWYCRPPNSGAPRRGGTGGAAAAAAAAAPGAPAGQAGHAWRRRVSSGPRAPPSVTEVSAHTRRWPGAGCLARGRDTRQKAEWEGPGRLPSSPETLSLRPKPTQDCAPSSINYAARWPPRAGPDVQ